MLHGFSWRVVLYTLLHVENGEYVGQEKRSRITEQTDLGDVSWVNHGPKSTRMIYIEREVH